MSKKIIHQNSYWKIFEESQGKYKVYNSFHKRDSVAVLPIYKKKIFLLNEYKLAIEKKIPSIITGDILKNESILNAASRELREEAGIIGDKFNLIKSLYYHPGLSNFKIHFVEAICFNLELKNSNGNWYELTEINNILSNQLISMPTFLAINLIQN